MTKGREGGGKLIEAARVSRCTYVEESLGAPEVFMLLFPHTGNGSRGEMSGHAVELLMGLAPLLEATLYTYFI